MMTIKNIMTTNLIKAGDDSTIDELVGLIEQHRIHHIPIINHANKLIGIVSDRDVINRVSPFLDTEHEREIDRESLTIHAKSIMSNNPITVTIDTRIETASILLLEHNFSCLPVINDEDDTLVGIITWKDILNHYVYPDSNE